MLNELDEMIRRQKERLAARDESNLPKDIEHTHVWKPGPNPALGYCVCGAEARKVAKPSAGTPS